MLYAILDKTMFVFCFVLAVCSVFSAARFIVGACKSIRNPDLKKSREFRQDQFLRIVVSLGCLGLIGIPYFLFHDNFVNFNYTLSIGQHILSCLITVVVVAVLCGASAWSGYRLEKLETKAE